MEGAIGESAKKEKKGKHWRSRQAGFLDAVSHADCPIARKASRPLRHARQKSRATPGGGKKSTREWRRRAAASEQAVVVVGPSLSRQQEGEKLAFQIPSAHPDVLLLVHQGTDLVNREPVG
jgi:hypothetical protein